MREVEVMRRERERGRRREARRRARAPSFAQRAGPLPLCQTRARDEIEKLRHLHLHPSHTHTASRGSEEVHTHSPPRARLVSRLPAHFRHTWSRSAYMPPPRAGVARSPGACGNKYTETDRQTQKRHAAMRSVETRHASPTHTPPKRMRAHSPAPSSRPRAMLRFCTAAPLAPLPRLSSRTATTHVWRSALS